MMIPQKRSASLKTSIATLSGVALLFSTVLSNAGEGGGRVSGIADREIARRQARVQDAMAAIARGDKLFADKDYEGALNEYKTALDLLPDAPLTRDWRDVAAAKYCDAAVELAKQRAQNGRFADAKTLLVDAMNRKPDCMKAKTLMKQLDDPDRYEQALTPEHVKNVDDVKRHLELGKSYHNLGDYDNANKEYQDALRIDHYNTAARRDMEMVEREKARYYEAARDQQRAKMLNAVNAGWEDQVPTKFDTTSGLDINNTINSGRYYTEKMQRIIFPGVQFQGASIEEAIEFLRIKSKDLDTIERDPTKKGVNIILKPGTTASTAQISLDLHDVPMVEALRYITELAGMKYKVEPFAVVVVPITEIGNEQYTRTFKVPPDFLTSTGGGDAPAGAAPPADPFAAKTPGGAAATATTNAIPSRPTARVILEGAGIGFPEGASAVFNAATSQLVVKNTQPNLDAVEAYVDSLLRKVPQQIFITCKFVEVSQNNTDELGFDWLLGQFNVGGSSGVFAGGGTSGNSPNGPTAATNYPFTLNGTPVGGTAVTAGNRSGNAAISPDSIDGLISGNTNTTNTAPGVFSIAGVFTDPQFQVVIRALAQKKGTDLMSAPSVTTRSGQRASVEVVREFIYPTEFNPPQIPTQFGAVGGTTGNAFGGGSSSFPVTPTTPTAFTMRPVGVKMEVDPVIGPDGYTIDLSLAPEVTEFDGFINYGSPIQTSATDALGNPTTVVLTPNIINQPVFSTRKVTTAVTIWDGQTVAMGGLIREDVQDVEDKVPVLGDIPILGRLFQTKAESHVKTNLMVFVTAKLIDPSGQSLRTPTSGTSIAPAGPDTVSATGEPGVLPPPMK
jgi:general secretion pathway protein D